MFNNSIFRHWRSLRHTRLSALVWRLRTLAERVRMDQFPGGLDLCLEAPAPDQASSQPRPQLTGIAPASEITDCTGSAQRVVLPGMELTLTVPMNWHLGAPQLTRMHLHYMDYLGAAEDGLFKDLVRDWMRQCGKPSRGAWADAWNPYAVSLRCVAWMQESTRRGLDLSDEWGKEFLHHLARQLRFLEGHLELDVRGNHLVKNIRALLWGSAFFEGPDAKRWRHTAEHHLLAELGDQILPDGFHFERSPSYHLQVLADLLECAALPMNEALRDRLLAVLGSMASAALNLSHPDGLPALFKDGGLHMAPPASACVEMFKCLSGRGLAPTSGPFALPHGGYFGFHSQASCFILQCGAAGADHLPAHAHGDLLSFEWSVNGQRIVVDTGVKEYQEGPLRALARSTRAHNTLTLDGLDQCEFWKSFRMGRRAAAVMDAFDHTEGTIRFEGRHSGYAHLDGSPIHHRLVAASDGSLQITDRVVGGKGQHAVVRLHFHPALILSGGDSHIEIRGENVLIELRSDKPMTIRKSLWFPEIGHQVDNMSVDIDLGHCPCAGSFTMIAHALEGPGKLHSR